MAHQSSEAGFLMKTVAARGSTFRYVVYVPPEYDPVRSWPLIVFLNGRGECGDDGLKQIGVGLGPAVIADAGRWPFIVLFPQKQYTDSRWEDEHWMVMAVLRKTRRELNVDAARMYLTGISQGGHGTWTIAAKHPDLFAAIAPICGWANEAAAKALAGKPIWIFHGQDDPVVAPSAAEQMAAYINESGGSCKLTIYPGVGHNCWDKAYREEELGAWLLEHHT